MDTSKRTKRLKLDEPPFVGRTRFLAEADRNALLAIRSGILFVVAFWSGTSLRSFCRLREALSKFDAEGRLEAVVVDTDGCPDLLQAPELANIVFGGNGETAWVRGGKVLYSAQFNSHPQAFEIFTRQLLEDCAAQ